MRKFVNYPWSWLGYKVIRFMLRQSAGRLDPSF